MQALKLKASSGWQWVGGGWRLFRRQPFSFAALLFFYWLLLLCASAVIGWLAQGIGAALPFVAVDVVTAIGSLLVAMLTPALTVGFLQACRAASSGLPVHPVFLFAPFRAGRRTITRLLTLGSVQMGALVLILLFTSGTSAFKADTPAETAASQQSPVATNPAQMTPAEQEEIRREAVERVMQGLAYLPVALLMWYAPMLVAWHGLSPGKALFFSLVAVWRNRAAFVVYGLAWLAIWMTMSFAIAIVTSLIGLGNLAALVAAPIVMLMLTCMYCSVYPTYETVFVEPAIPAPQPEA